ncbi:MAG: ABC transporter substrate-binding protein [Rhizobiales bacterium]|nr:ABC transporter substrate-binding protein [Hyphomicrobiales bacterium]
MRSPHIGAAKRYWLSFLFIFGLVLPLASGAAHAASCAGEGVVKSAAASFLAARKAGTAEAFANAVAKHADITALALAALGPYRKELPASRQGEYIAKTKAYIGRFLLRYADRIAQPNLVVDSCAGDLVKTTAGSSKLVWRVGGGRIRDVQASGIWLANQMRAKFVAEIRRGGHDKIDALFNFLGN